MKINYTARKVTLKDNFKERVEKKLKKYDRVFSEDAEAMVTVTVYKNRQTVEITIKDNGMIYRVENTRPEMNEALDIDIDKLGRQIRKNKTKLEKRISLRKKFPMRFSERRMFLLSLCLLTKLFFV